MYKESACIAQPYPYYTTQISALHKYSSTRHNSSILGPSPNISISTTNLKQSIIMPLTQSHRTHATAAPRTTRTTRTKPSLKTKLMGTPRTTRSSTRHTPGGTTTTTTTTKTTRTTHGAGAGAGHGTHGATTAHHHKRHATMGDKVSGAMMKLKGSLTHRPGLKVSF